MKTKYGRLLNTNAINILETCNVMDINTWLLEEDYTINRFSERMIYG